MRSLSATSPASGAQGMEELWPPARPTLETMHILQSLQPMSEDTACERMYDQLTQRSRHSQRLLTACSKKGMASRPHRGRVLCTW